MLPGQISGFVPLAKEHGGWWQLVDTFDWPTPTSIKVEVMSPYLIPIARAFPPNFRTSPLCQWPAMNAKRVVSAI